MTIRYLMMSLLLLAGIGTEGQTLEEAFKNPPAEAKPLMIWQWMDGLVSKEGITADLEAYKEAGIGGVQNFQVGGPMQGLAKDTTNAIGSERWQRLMRFAIDECRRLGLSFGTHNCPGWSSSAYPAVKQEYAMQKLVWSTTVASGRSRTRLIMPETDPQYSYYQDVAVIAVPDQDSVPMSSVRNLTGQMNSRGVLHWKMPQGRWRIYRFGHTPNGKTNVATSPESGVGLECDKMNREAIRHFWESYPSVLLSLAGDEVGKTFQRLEIDSYEAGGQDWTSAMPEEFQKRRGYDMLTWLPVAAGMTIGDKASSKKFLNDWRETVTDLFAEYYYGYMSQLAHEHGLQLLVQPYGTGGGSGRFNPINTDKICRQLATDDPISAEFWTNPINWGWNDVPRVVDATRRAGHEIVYAEGFTCWPLYAWKDDPARLKAIADSAFCRGINKLMLHAGAHNPWVNAKPGMSFGMWGTQWTPGQTWWKDGAKPLFSYFARCQALLQRGVYVDDFKSRDASLTTDAHSIHWIHRRDGETDIYFVANTKDSTLMPHVTITGTGRLPEVWDPETGNMSEAEIWKMADGKTQVTLNLTTRRALFLVFRNPTTETGSAKESFSDDITDTIPITGTWTVGFDEDKVVEWPSLMPWNESIDSDIKYFSGTAHYEQHLYLNELDRHYRYILDLGEVKNLATVRVNGKVCGTLWRPPFTIDITEALLGGDNLLKVDVTNLWVNRMVGDEQEPDDVEWSEPVAFGAAPNSPAIGRFMKEVPEWLSQGQPRPSKRKAVVSFKFFEKDTPLLRSGLIGPVVLKKTAVLAQQPSVENELWIKYGKHPIYGVLSTPVNGQKKHPIVIVAHGFNGSHHFGRSYFKMLNEMGYMCYTFDFPCGGTGSRTDNNTVNMSVIDEQKALETIVRYFKSHSDVDKKNIVLLGSSQGGLIAALTAASLQKDISKLILEFPALCIPDNWNSRYPQVSDIPDTTKVWQVPIGRQFFTELRNMDPYQAVEAYRRPVLIIHGDADPVVPIDYSRRAVKLYKDARLLEIPNAGHGFGAEDFQRSLACIRQFLCPSRHAVINGVPWYDQHGNVVNAHGAGITYDNGRYWLFGEYKSDSTNAFPGFSCYSSSDLATWRFERVVLPVQKNGILGPQRVGERVKVMKCPKTGQYVMLMHTDAMDYNDPHIGIATSPAINGEYQLKGTLQYKGKPIKQWDMGVFQDDDGTGYLLIHHGPIYRLSNDYLSVDTMVARVEGMGESPAMFKKDGIYYLLTSNLTSWERNDNYYFTAPSPAGPWTRQGNFCPEGSLTWNSQTTFVMKLPDGTPMYMGDRWSYPHQASAATYVWLPLQTNGVRLSIPAYWNAWDVRTIAPVDPLKECLKTQVNFSSNDIGAKNTIPFKGRRIFVTGEANAHGGYAKLTIRNQKGMVCVTTLIDFYAKMPEQGIRYASPILPMDEYELVIEVTGDRSNWTDKRHNLYGTDGCFVNVLAVYNE